MGEEVLEHIQELKHLPDDIHWFCPRQGSDDYTTYYDEDRYGETDGEDEADRRKRLKAIEDAERRRATVVAALPIFAFDGENAKGFQRWLQGRLEDMLSTCDVCVRLYHKSRATLKQKLQATYDEEEVAAFMERFDGLNVERIANHLDHARDVLQKLPPPKRKLQALEQADIFAFFEALSCDPFLRSEHQLAKHLDEPFALVQTNRMLRLAYLLPACTEFLFSENDARRDWAYKSWTKLSNKEPTKEEFDWCIKGPLFRAEMRVHMNNLDFNFVPRFWAGVKAVVGSLNKDLITHSLRAMDCDIYKLLLDHFQLDTDAFPDMAATLLVLLQKSPADFWEAMGSLGAPAVINQILQCPALNRILKDPTDAGATRISQLFGWVIPLITSLKSSNQPPACRALASALLDRFTADKYPEANRSACFNLGLNVLLQTMNSLAEGTYQSLSAASITDALEILEYFLERILKQTKGIKHSGSRPESAAISLKLVEKALSLDCLVLRIEHELLKRNGQLGPERHSRSAGIWQKITAAIGNDEQALASFALMGARDLIGLERIVAKKGASLSKDSEQFNKSFGTLCDRVASILDRITEKFSAHDMEGLFRTPRLANGVVSTLLLSDDSARQSSVELLKALSSESARRDAFASVLKSNYYSTLTALNEVLKLITARRVFTPVSTMLRFSADIIDVLCDSSDGLLRTEKLKEQDVQATLTFWELQWSFLRTIFEKTEDWGDVGYGKDLMMEFCRDTMQFAERLFNEYHVFTDTLSEEDKVESKMQDKLLSYPKNAIESMVKWLRLRDEYLISTIVALVTKLLRKLGDLDIMIPDEALAYIDGIIDKQIKTKLSPQQIAELNRAVEEHTGEPSSPTPEEQKAGVKKQGSISTWVKPGQAPTSLQQQAVDAQKATRENIQIQERLKAELAERKAKAAEKKLPQRDIKSIKKAQSALSQAQNQAEFLKKRQAEKEAQAKRVAEARAKASALRGDVAGSALKGLGTVGRDHAVKGAGMMVSSDEESSDEDDAMDRELFGNTRTRKRDKALVNGNIEFVNDLPPARAPVKVKRMVRSVKDMRARLAPDLSILHRTILSWDYFHKGQLPPGSKSHEYSAVPGKFRDPVQYKQVFQPLLLLEAWQSFVNAREQAASPYPLKVVSRGNVDALIEVTTTLQHSDNKDQQVGEGDVVLLSRQRIASQEEPSCLARIRRVNRKKAALEVIYRVAPGNPMLPALVPNASIHATKIQSITPLEREFGALQGLQYYDLCDYIVKAEPSHLLTYNDKTLNPISENYNLNRAQAKAVKSALDNDAFTLIQGPPGSGKTKTIVAIVGALLSHSLRDFGTPIPQPNAAPGQPQSADRAPPKKLLVCAPSNAAVDELVMRLKEGVRTLNGGEKKIKVVRLGRSDAINANVQDVTLEELVTKRLTGAKGSGDQRMETQKLMKEHQTVSESLRLARDQMDDQKPTGAEAAKLQDEIGQLIRKKKDLSSKIDDAKDKEGAANRQADLERRKAQQAVLDESHVICATLSGSGHDMFQSLNIEFETVIVDEAAQCVEMSVLIPLKYGCAKCILVGDPKQLPPTVFSREAAEYQYEQSLFVRMQRNSPEEVHLLDTQYRMHPEISAFPSATFYDHRLLDGPDMAGLRQRPWHANSLFAPYWFFDVQGQHQSAGHSFINKTEIKLASQLYDQLTAAYGKNYDFKGKIGVITPYKSQLRELKGHFSNKYGSSILESIEFNTTDAFQGRESEIIIFSCVRASPSGGIGFLQDIRRMNVGLTRAKSSLWVLGNADTLCKGEFWHKLIEDAKQRDRFLYEDEYKPSLASGKPLKGKHKAMIEKPKIKAEEAIKKEEKSKNGMSRSSSPMSVDSHRVQHVKEESITKSIKHEKNIKQEPKVKHEHHHIKQEDNNSEFESRKRKAEDDSEDTEMPDAPPSAEDDDAPPTKPAAPAAAAPAVTGFFGTSAAPKNVIRKRPVSTANGGVFMKKKPKVNPEGRKGA